MIQLDEKDIGEFQRIWQKEYGEEISTEEAQQYAERVVLLASIALDPRPP